MKEVSPEAKKLWEYLYSNRVLQSCEEKNHPLVVSFHFVDINLALVNELHLAGWIQKRQHSDFYVLGTAVIKESIFAIVEENSIEDSLENLLSRYSNYQREVIARLFTELGKRSRGGKMTSLQQKAELEYFNKYPPIVIERSAITYISLGEEQKHGVAYMRGIIRNDKQGNTPTIVTERPTEKISLPSPSFDKVVDRRRRISEVFTERSKSVPIDQHATLLEEIEREIL